MPAAYQAGDLQQILSGSTTASGRSRSTWSCFRRRPGLPTGCRRRLAEGSDRTGPRRQDPGSDQALPRADKRRLRDREGGRSGGLTVSAGARREGDRPAGRPASAGSPAGSRPAPGSSPATPRGRLRVRTHALTSVSARGMPASGVPAIIEISPRVIPGESVARRRSPSSSSASRLIFPAVTSSIWSGATSSAP